MNNQWQVLAVHSDNQNSTMKFTFLLPAYKGRFLDEMLRSIQDQTYTDFKVIISDDCSPESLKSICEPYLSDPRFTYRRNAENMGIKSLVSHWNMLIDMCDTEYLILASDDDIYAATFLEEANKLTLRHPEVDLIRSNVKRIDANGIVTAMDDPSLEYEPQIDFLYNLFCRRRLKCIANYVFRTSSLKSAGGFVYFPLAWGSDDITVMRESKNGVCNISHTLFYFRLSGLNITTNSSEEVIIKRIKAREQNLIWFDDFAKTIKLDGTPLHKNRFHDFKTFYITEWTKTIVDGSCFLPWKEFSSCYSFLKKRKAITGFMEKVHLLWTWIRAHR